MSMTLNAADLHRFADTDAEVDLASTAPLPVTCRPAPRSDSTGLDDAARPQPPPAQIVNKGATPPNRRGDSAAGKQADGRRRGDDYPHDCHDESDDGYRPDDYQPSSSTWVVHAVAAAAAAHSSATATPPPPPSATDGEVEMEREPTAAASDVADDVDYCDDSVSGGGSSGDVMLSSATIPELVRQRTGLQHQHQQHGDSAATTVAQESRVARSANHSASTSTYSSPLLLREAPVSAVHTSGLAEVVRQLTDRLTYFTEVADHYRQQALAAIEDANNERERRLATEYELSVALGDLNEDDLARMRRLASEFDGYALYSSPQVVYNDDEDDENGEAALATPRRPSGTGARLYGEDDDDDGDASPPATARSHVHRVTDGNDDDRSAAAAAAVSVKADAALKEPLTIDDNNASVAHDEADGVRPASSIDGEDNAAKKAPASPHVGAGAGEEPEHHVTPRRRVHFRDDSDDAPASPASTGRCPSCGVASPNPKAAKAATRDMGTSTVEAVPPPPVSIMKHRGQLTTTTTTTAPPQQNNVDRRSPRRGLWTALLQLTRQLVVTWVWWWANVCGLGQQAETAADFVESTWHSIVLGLAVSL